MFFSRRQAKYTSPGRSFLSRIRVLCAATLIVLLPFVSGCDSGETIGVERANYLGVWENAASGEDNAEYVFFGEDVVVAAQRDHRASANGNTCYRFSEFDILERSTSTLTISDPISEEGSIRVRYGLDVEESLLNVRVAEAQGTREANAIEGERLTYRRSSREIGSLPQCSTPPPTPSGSLLPGSWNLSNFEVNGEDRDFPDADSARYEIEFFENPERFKLTSTGENGEQFRCKEGTAVVTSGRTPIGFGYLEVVNQRIDFVSYECSEYPESIVGAIPSRFEVRYTVLSENGGDADKESTEVELMAVDEGDASTLAEDFIDLNRVNSEVVSASVTLQEF